MFNKKDVGNQSWGMLKKAFKQLFGCPRPYAGDYCESIPVLYAAWTIEHIVSQKGRRAKLFVAAKFVNPSTVPFLQEAKVGRRAQ